jgi:hypothetical protein
MSAGAGAPLEVGRQPLQFFDDEGIGGAGGNAAAVLGLAQEILSGGHDRSVRLGVFLIGETG